MKRIFSAILISVLTMLVCSCGQTRNVSAQTKGIEDYEGDVVKEDPVTTLLFPAKKNTTYILKRDIDLLGKTYIMPEGVTIKGKKGVIRNGTLIGRNTMIEGCRPVFDKVTIKGEWKVPQISTSLFKDLSYDNSLRDVMSLTNETISNNVEILEGVYYIKLTNNQETGVFIRSNTNVILDGEIRLRPNSYTNYHVVEITGSNCSLSGKGVVYGDKPTHTGIKGEWGMGVDFVRAENATVSGITIKDCWGDCIYVGDGSKNITITNCILDNGRRQGISITSADSVWISDCVISNVSGTNPQYAIDVEPNKNLYCTNIYINKVQSVNCVGGFVFSGNAENAIVKGVHLSNCTVRGATHQYPLVLYKVNDVTIENCDVDSESEYTVLIEKTTSVNARNNTLRANGNRHFNKVKSKDMNLENNLLIVK